MAGFEDAGSTTWSVQHVLPKCEGDLLAHLSTAGSVDEARKVVADDEALLGFVYSPTTRRFWLRKIGSGFHTRTPCRADAGARGYEWHYLRQRVPVPKVLFLTLPMRGHVVPMMRLAAWFARRSDFEAHVWLGGKMATLAPDGAVLHGDFGAEDWDACAASYEATFASLVLCEDWCSSMAKMVAEGLRDDETAGLSCRISVGASRLVKELRPNLVVADEFFSSDGALAGLCQRLCMAPFVELDCPGQPKESIFGYLRMFLKNIDSLSKVHGRGEENEGHLLAVTGAKLPKPHSWLHILPSCEALARKQLSRTDVCVGPFCAIPEPRDGLGSRQRPDFASDSQVEEDLRAWLLGASDTDPIVYVAFGTLACINQDIAGRLAEGLANGPWRVLWALPREQQAVLPEHLMDSSGPKWRVEAFVPQVDILSFDRVRVFVSHCGQNSTQEALSFGVPMVCVPFHCDQFEWAEAICDVRKAGVRLNKITMSSADVQNVVTSVLNEEKYRLNAQACAEDMFKSSREVSEEGEFPGVVKAAHLLVDVLEGRWRPKPPKGFWEKAFLAWDLTFLFVCNLMDSLSFWFNRQ